MKEILKKKFVKLVDTETTHNGNKVFEVHNKKGEVLGTIIFFKKWRKHIFTQQKSGIAFDNTCLIDIAEFLNHLDK